MSGDAGTELPLRDDGIGGFEVGDYVGIERTIGEDLVSGFADLSLDRSPLHVDRDYARRSGFPGNVAHGMLVSSHFSAIVGMLLPGTRALLTAIQFDYVKPVLVGDTLSFSARITEIDAERSVLRLNCLALRGSEVCVRGTAIVEVRT